MNKYRIKMNDKVYVMEIELTSGDEKPVAKTMPAVVATPKAATVAAVPAPKSAPAAAAGSGSVSSPMPGTILKVNVAVGDTVQTGQTVLVLEAMKMENEIAATKAGVVAQLAVQAGQTVANGEFLFSVE